MTEIELVFSYTTVEAMNLATATNTAASLLHARIREQECEIMTTEQLIDDLNELRSEQLATLEEMRRNYHLLQRHADAITDQAFPF
jgi:hypothetical protein